jgi:hypothetical protein
MEAEWHDKRFPADDDAIFDRRITVKYNAKTLPEKFVVNRERFESRVGEFNWSRPTEVY